MNKVKSSRAILDFLRAERKFKTYPPRIIAAFRRWAYREYIEEGQPAAGDEKIIADNPDFLRYVKEVMEEMLDDLLGKVFVQMIWHDEGFQGKRSEDGPWFLHFPAAELRSSARSIRKRWTAST